MRPRLLAITALVAIAATSTACRNRQVAPAPPPAPEIVADPSPNTADAERAAAEARDRAERERLERERLERERLAAERLRVITATIYFDLDRSDLSAGARSTLDAKLGILASSPEIRIRITGHADERGSDEYNIALGQRRAAAAKRYLVQRGIDQNRIDVTTFGEERPVCTESHEGCWSQNRRDEFEVTTVAALGRGPESS